MNFENLLKKINALPWRAIYFLAAVSFIVATLAANLVSMKLMPDLTIGGSGGRGVGITDLGESDTVAFKPALTDAELKIIYDRNLFNKTGELGDTEAGGEDGGATEEIRKTDLPLKLLGIIYGGTPYNGLVTIENTSNSKINSFVVGDVLVKEAQIAEIHRTKVFIQRGKRKEFLELEQKEVVRNSRQKKAEPAAPGGVAPIASGPAAKRFKEEGFEREGNEMMMSQDYKQRILTQDFTKVLQDAKAVPNIVDNQTRGFRLERIREGSVYQKAGFQNGDVVEEINGVPLTDAGSAVKTLQGLRNASEIDVMVNRGGSTFNMRLQVK